MRLNKDLSGGLKLIIEFRGKKGRVSFAYFAGKKSSSCLDKDQIIGRPGRIQIDNCFGTLKKRVLFIG